MRNCSICGKELKYREYRVAGDFSPLCCRGCQIKFRKTEFHKTMPHEERIKKMVKRFKIKKETKGGGE